MKSYYDLEDKEQVKLDELIDIYDSRLPSKRGEGVGRISHSEYGLCSTCSKFEVVESEFKVKLARCGYFKMMLNTTDPVKGCSEYIGRKEMSLWDMKNLATLIDAPNRKAGFIVE